MASPALYIPVHKRRCSDNDPSSTPSSRAESPLSESDFEPLVYCRDRLLALAKSPLATMPKDVKDGLRERLPEIVMSRKQRKAIEYRTIMQQRTQPVSLEIHAAQPSPLPPPPPPSPPATLAPTPSTLPTPPTPQRHTYTFYVPPSYSRSHSRPVPVPGRAWWNVPKSAPVDDMKGWRKAGGFASIPVA